ncbi:hypothetical protein QBC38DRAFT_505006 [Podospora fimiseda]|uniref:Uncharacterized protein n=1 Tax=Podospora fimiseda TaxID=252190 RepID=A0AAN6YL61_9PEZI|nr:hypothetical protein QBC38DRAFT_505006 [Podospora fimiseda]
MLCALCREVPEEPVVSRKTGTVFEKRLILKLTQRRREKRPAPEKFETPQKGAASSYGPKSRRTAATAAAGINGRIADASGLALQIA